MRLPSDFVAHTRCIAAPAAPSKGQQRSDAFKDNVASSAGHGMGLGFGATIGSGVARAILPF